MSAELKTNPIQEPESSSADQQIRRVVDLITAEFNGDTSAYFEAVVREAAASITEEQEEDRTVESFLRSYR